MSTFHEPPIPACYCGGQRFERVIVRRPGRPEYPTDFMKCSGCWVMFHVPEPPKDPTLAHEEFMRAINERNAMKKPRS